jgi:hypothetical protein
MLGAQYAGPKDDIAWSTADAAAVPAAVYPIIPGRLPPTL